MVMSALDMLLPFRLDPRVQVRGAATALLLWQSCPARELNPGPRRRVGAAVLTAALPLLASDMLADTLVIHQLQRGRDVRAASVSTSLPQPVLARAGGPLDQPVLVADEVHP